MKRNTWMLFLSGCAMLFVAASCTHDKNDTGLEYMPDMYRSPSYETNSPNPNFTDSMTDRLPVKGTIPVGFKPFPYDGSNEAYMAAGNEWMIPNEMKTEKNLKEGKRLYEIYCVHCHGSTGNGDGSVVKAGFAPPPSYSTGNSSRGGKMSDLTDGKIYHTITYGINMMGSHASQLLPDERMKIVMYVHTLQGNAATAAKKDTVMTASASTKMDIKEKKEEIKDLKKEMREQKKNEKKHKS